MLTKKSRDELRAIMKKDYGEEIADEQAEELGSNMLRLTKLSLTAQARKIEKDVPVSVGAYFFSDSIPVPIKGKRAGLKTAPPVIHCVKFNNSNEENLRLFGLVPVR